MDYLKIRSENVNDCMIDITSSALSLDFETNFVHGNAHFAE